MKNLYGFFVGLSFLIINGCLHEMPDIPDSSSIPAIEITEVTPLTVVAGSGCIQVTGENLNSLTRIRLGGNEISNYTIVSDQQVSICPPAMAQIGLVNLELGNINQMTSAPAQVSITESVLNVNMSDSYIPDINTRENINVDPSQAVLPNEQITIFGTGFDVGYPENNVISFLDASHAIIPATILDVKRDRVVVEVPETAVSGAVALGFQAISPELISGDAQSFYLAIIGEFAIQEVKTVNTQGAYALEQIGVTLDKPLEHIAKEQPIITVGDTQVSITQENPLVIVLPEVVADGMNQLCIQGDLDKECTALNVLGAGHTDLLRAPVCETFQGFKYTYPFSYNINLNTPQLEKVDGEATNIFVVDNNLQAVHHFRNVESYNIYQGLYPLPYYGEYTQVIGAFGNSDQYSGFIAVYESTQNKIIAIPLRNAVEAFQFDLSYGFVSFHIIDDYRFFIIQEDEDNSYLSVVDMTMAPYTLSHTRLPGDIIAQTPVNPPVADYTIDRWPTWVFAVHSEDINDYIVFAGFGTSGKNITLFPDAQIADCGTDIKSGTCVDAVPDFAGTVTLAWVNDSNTLAFHYSYASLGWGTRSYQYLLQFDKNNFIGKELLLYPQTTSSICIGQSPKHQPIIISPYDVLHDGHWFIWYAQPICNDYRTFLGFIDGDFDTFVDNEAGPNVSISQNSLGGSVSSYAIQKTIGDYTWIQPAIANDDFQSFIQYGDGYITFYNFNGIDTPSVKQQISGFPYDAGLARTYGQILIAPRETDDFIVFDLSKSIISRTVSPQVDNIELHKWYGADHFSIQFPYGELEYQSEWLRPQMSVSSSGITSDHIDLFAEGDIVNASNTDYLSYIVSNGPEYWDISIIPYDGYSTKIELMQTISLDAITDTCYDYVSLGSPIVDPYPLVSTDFSGNFHIMASCFAQVEDVIEGCPWDDPSNTDYSNPNYTRGSYTGIEDRESILGRTLSRVYVWPYDHDTNTDLQPYATELCGNKAVGMYSLPLDEEKLMVIWAVGHPREMTEYDPCYSGACIFNPEFYEITMASILDISSNKWSNITPQYSSDGKLAVALQSEDESLVGSSNDYRINYMYLGAKIFRDHLATRWIFAANDAYNGTVRSLSLEAGLLEVKDIYSQDGKIIDLAISPDNKRIYLLLNSGYEVHVLENAAQPIFRGYIRLDEPTDTIEISESGDVLITKYSNGYCVLSD